MEYDGELRLALRRIAEIRKQLEEMGEEEKLRKLWLSVDAAAVASRESWLRTANERRICGEV